MARFEIVTLSITPPSTLSIARPWQSSNRQFVIAIFLNPPFDSVPNLIRPVRDVCFFLPSSCP